MHVVNILIHMPTILRMTDYKVVICEVYTAFINRRCITRNTTGYVSKLIKRIQITENIKSYV